MFEKLKEGMCFKFINPSDNRSMKYVFMKVNGRAQENDEMGRAVNLITGTVIGVMKITRIKRIKINKDQFRAA